MHKYRDLKVWQRAMAFTITIYHESRAWPDSEKFGLISQIRRAATSIPLNIAEGAGEYAIDEKIRFYRMAKRSATECAGILDVCQRLELIGENQYVTGRELLIRIVSMLIKMAQKNR